MWAPCQALSSFKHLKYSTHQGIFLLKGVATRNNTGDEKINARSFFWLKWVESIFSLFFLFWFIRITINSFQIGMSGRMHIFKLIVHHALRGNLTIISKNKLYFNFNLFPKAKLYQNFSKIFWGIETGSPGHTPCTCTNHSLRNSSSSSSSPPEVISRSSCIIQH